MEHIDDKLTFNVYYDADEQSLKQHRMPAGRLIEAIKEMNALITQADRTLHGRQHSIELFVAAPAIPGSMGIEFVAEILNPQGAASLIRALGLASVAGGLTVAAVRAALGKKPEERITVYNNIFDIAQEINGATVIDVETSDETEVAVVKVNGKELYCQEEVARLIENPRVRKAIHGVVTKPIEGYGSPSFKLDNQETPEVEVSLDAEDIQKIRRLQVTESLAKNHSLRASVTFTQVNFDKPKGWKIRWEEKEVPVEIADEAFLKRINSNRQNFRKSDEYQVELMQTTTYNETGGEKVSYTLTKAKKKISPKPKQAQ